MLDKKACRPTTKLSGARSASAWIEQLDRCDAVTKENDMSKLTVGRFTFVAWLDKGLRLDGGRVIYHTARKYWLRLGALILSVEITDRDRTAA
jgi:hypothetical protein